MSQLVSVVVPVYNLKDHIEYCVNSILKQTYKDIEVILVDDGSTDGSSEICDILAEKDRRIRVIHKVNAGVSAARNTGLDAAKGNYVMFVDGDDIIAPNSVELLLQDISKADCVMSGFGYKRISDYDCQWSTVCRTLSDYNIEDVIHDLLIGSYVHIGVWAKLFNRKKIADLRFVDGKGANEDKFFLFQYLMKNRGIITQRTDELYGYYVRKGSACNSPYSKRRLDVIYFSRRIVKEIKQHKPQFITQAEYNDAVTHLSVLKSIIRSHKYRTELSDFYRVKMNLLKLYGDRPLSFFGRYKYEIMALRFSDYLYILCVYGFDIIRNRRSR